MSATIHRFTGRRVRYIDFAQQRPGRFDMRYWWTIALMLVAMPPAGLAGMFWLEIYLQGHVEQLVDGAYPAMLVWALIGGGVFVKWWQATK